MAEPDDLPLLDRSSRATRGKRMNKLLDEEIEEDELFWNQDALKEDDEDNNYEEEAEVADEFDSDFDEDEPEPEDEAENIAEDRLPVKKRLIFPGKTLAKKKSKKKVLSKLERDPKVDESSEPKKSSLYEHQDPPEDLEGERIVRKSTRTSVIVRQAERDAIRAALQASVKPIKRKKEGEEKRMTQEEMLLEAAETEIRNLRNLERVLAREEEVKRRAVVHKAVYNGPQIRYSSKDGKNFLEFTKGVSFHSELSTKSEPYPQKAVCAVTGLPAKDYRNGRAALFNGIEEGAVSASSYSSHEIDEHENEIAIDGLQDRVHVLKRLIGDIHEVDSHNRMLDRMHAKGSKLLGSRAFSAMAARLADLCNGERVVVFLFVSCILFSTPSSLAPEAATLLILSFAALLAEISTEGSCALSQFKTRPGASSGMLLGSVTIPAAMLSRLILVSRAISQHNVGSEDFSYISMLYWAVSACNFGVLILCLTLQNPPGDTSSQLGGVSAAIYSLFCTIFYVCSCYLSLSAKSYAAWHAAMNLLWYLCHGIATVALIQHILHKFPYCASIGEALLVTGGLVLYAGDMLALSLSKILSSLLFMKHAFVEYGTKSEIHMVLQGMLLGLLLFPSFYKSVLYIGCLLTSFNKSGAQLGRGWAYVGISRSMLFYISLLAMLILIVPTWMMFAEDFHIHPLQWVVIFVFTEPLKRTTLCIYWISVICASVFRFYNISKQSKIERILLRKYYHLVAVLMFVPAILSEPTFLDLAFGAALAVFLILEMIRVWEIWPLGHIVRKFMNAFTDHRDSEILVISHFSLLLGCALPKWMSSGYNDRPLVPFAGILSLGIGDTMASMVGHKYGVLRWSKTGKKTIEGTVAGIASVLVACFILLHLASAGYILSQHWVPLLLAVTLSGLLEAYTAQLDNAFIPLVFYSLLCL